MSAPEGWTIKYDPKPIPDRRHDYTFWHVDHEQAYAAASYQGALEAITEMEDYP